MRHLSIGAVPEKVIATDWYDGAVEGLAEYGGGSVVRFTLVGDALAIPRIFAIEPSPHKSLNTAVSAAGSLGAPVWPVWLPAYGRLPADTAQRAMQVLLHPVDGSRLVLAVIVCDGIDCAILKSRWLNTARLQSKYSELIVLSRYSPAWRSLAGC